MSYPPEGPEQTFPDAHRFVSTIKILSRLRTDEIDRESLLNPSNRKVPDRPITGAAIFASTALLEAISERREISRTSDQDVESFAWAFIFSSYKMALSDATYPASGREALEEEFQSLFSAIYIKDVLQNRLLAFSRTQPNYHPGISSLRGYIDVHLRDYILRESVVYIWHLLFRLQPIVSDPEVNPLIAKESSFSQETVILPLDKPAVRMLRTGLETIIRGTLPDDPSNLA
ncbi:hypothetical protein C8Q78DRAFT_993766 [Trametes maxima]|nr:hypothetical protein C8Q78DRAFT_993766 [Trametes maxima]